MKASELETICKQIAEELDGYSSSTSATDDWKECVGRIAPLVRSLPKSICDCIGDGKVSKMSFTRTEFPQDSKKGVVKDSLSVVFDRNAEWAWPHLVPLGLILSIVGLGVAIVIRTDPVPRRNHRCCITNECESVVSQNYNQHVIVQGGDHWSELNWTCSPEMAISSCETNSPNSESSAESTKEMQPNVQ